MPVANVPMTIETTLLVPVPSLPRSVFSLNSISSPRPRNDRQDSLLPRPNKQQIQKQNYKAIDSFIPVLPDEIKVNTDDNLRTITVFKDGYIYGINESTDTIGIFPLFCISSQLQSPSPALSVTNPIPSEGLASARSYERTPIDKIGIDNLETGLVAELDRTRLMLKLGVIIACLFGIVIIVVVLSVT